MLPAEFVVALWFGAAGCTAAHSPPAGSQGTTDMPTYYVLKVEKEGTLVRVEVNDVPVGMWRTPAAIGDTDQLNAWVHDGRNSMRVRLDVPEPDFKPGQAKLALSISPVQKDQAPGKPLVEFTWPPPDPADEQYPFEKVFHFQVDEPPPGELWTKARPVQLNDEHRAEIRRLVSELHAALQRRDREGAAKLLEWKAVDMRKAHYLPVTEARGDLREYLDFFLSEESWEIAPLKLEELEMHALSNNRLVWVTEPDYVNPIRTKPGAAPGIQIPLYFALLDGQWRIVR